jgi:hypothetical protein
MHGRTGPPRRPKRGSHATVMGVGSGDGGRSHARTGPRAICRDRAHPARDDARQPRRRRPEPDGDRSDPGRRSAGRSVARLPVLQLRAAARRAARPSLRRGGVLLLRHGEPLRHPDGRAAEQRDGRDPRRRPSVHDADDRAPPGASHGLQRRRHRGVDQRHRRLRHRGPVDGRMAVDRADGRRVRRRVGAAGRRPGRRAGVARRQGACKCTSTRCIRSIRSTTGSCSSSAAA